MATAATTSPSFVLSAPDFADWLSPILVKELRQGLKARAFVAIFILVQVVMALLVGVQLLAMANGASRNSMSGFDGFFWAFVWIPLIVLMPARGLMAVSEEVKANTLDLVQLTRMSAFRIVFGKWVALVAQSLLLVAAILPYAVLRYFFGQVDVVDDMRIIGLLTGVSLVMTAVAVALSSAPLAFRIIVLVLSLPFFFGLVMSSLFGGRMVFAGMGAGPSVWLLVGLLIVYVYVILEIAATRIAPMAENHAARKRGAALVMLGVAGLLALFADDETAGMWLGGCSILWSWIILEALCERTVPLPSLYGPFARRGGLGRLLGRVLYPGWATGINFTVLFYVGLFLVAFLTAGSSWVTTSTDDMVEAGVILAMSFGASITPIPILLMFPRVKQPIWLYVLIQALFGLVYAIASIVANTPGVTDYEALMWLAPFPPSVLFATMAEGLDDVPGQLYGVVTGGVVLIILVVLARRALMEFKLIGKLEKDALSGGGNPS